MGIKIKIKINNGKHIGETQSARFHLFSDSSLFKPIQTETAQPF